ncbi:AMP-binding protein [Piscinibacter sakaiensis]|uniref:AMP-binding protein n=1 Tax=Piscinibacter sakaiensis TaxID=1547922 RepID=UPI003AAE682B
MVANSNLKAFMDALGVDDYDTLLARADADPTWFWSALLQRLHCYRPHDQLLDDSRGAPYARWCVGGRSNIVLNCLDRHRETPIWQRDALLWEGESGTRLRWTYANLGAEVSRLAAGLESLGLTQGDVIGLYLPNIPQAVAAFLACAKIGAIAMPLFSGFGAGALRDRLQISGAAALITADGSTRRGTRLPMKAIADEAVSTLPGLRHVVVVRHLGIELPWQAGRDHAYDELVAGRAADHPTRQLPSDAPLMLMYTSGTSGKPKGTVHTHTGFAAKMLLDLGLMMDLQASDRLLWMSDMGWLVGPLVAVGVPLAGATIVLTDGGPDYPDSGRMWRLIEQYRVSFLGLAPTTARSFIGQGGGGIENHDLSSLRICASTGEVWTPEAWHWTFEQVCRRRVPLLNYSGGTEVGGGILCGTVLQPIKPCALSRAIPGMGAAVVDEQGCAVAAGVVGELVLRQPSIGLTRSLWNDDERYLESYWSALPGLWRHGDWAMVDADGYWYVLGRSDDTLKIAGKRTGPSEIEALLAATGHVVESAVVGLPDAIKGQAVCCVVRLMPGVTLTATVRDALSQAVVGGLGTPFRPKLFVAVDDLPKTRNMKIMRRVVRAACLGEDAGDLSSLVNPEAVAMLRQQLALAGHSP